MSADFWAGYVSGAIGIVIGNPLDIIKVRLQASRASSELALRPWNLRTQFESTSALVRGAAAPILGYGALNALLFVAYNRTLMAMWPSVTDPTNPVGVPLSHIWLAGAVGGLASWTISSPTELVKCQAQLSHDSSSWSIAKNIFKSQGLRGLYFGGLVTSIRDSVGYGFYFWSYELSKRFIPSENPHKETTRVLLCGGIAGVVTWASIFPIDVIKTRLQAQPLIGDPLPNHSHDRQALLSNMPNTSTASSSRTLTSIETAKQAYRQEGLGIFFRGLGVCSIRAFIVNAVQWATYEWIMKVLLKPHAVPQAMEKF